MHIMYFRFENGVFHLTQKYHQVRFRDTVQAKEYQLDELVGNVGGYMGLFLGYSLIHLPKLIKTLLLAVKRSINKKKVCSKSIIRK